MSHRPEKFYCKRTFIAQTNFLNDTNNTPQILDFLSSNHAELDRALKHLDQINMKSWHDIDVPSDEYDFFRFCENEINPAFLTLTEGVYGVFIHINAVVSRSQRGKSTDGLDIFNRVEEVKITDLELYPITIVILQGTQLLTEVLSLLIEQLRLRIKIKL